MEGACLLIFLIGYAIARNSAVADTELISGRVTAKEENAVSCSHSYSCNCREECSGSGKDRSCSTVCDTCYEHLHDYDWDVHTNAMGRSFTVDRVDRQGVNTPPRWAAIRIGEPAAFEHDFKNYIKADPGSILLRRGVTTPVGLALPVYPNTTYDYYRAARFVQVGLVDPNARVYNELLMDINGDLGPTKQANVVIVEVKTADPDYEYLVQQNWLNGKKNDVIVLLGVSNYPKIDFARIISWTQSEELKVELRDDIQKFGRVDDPSGLINIIKNAVATKFQRRHFRDFEYMMASVQPSPTATFILLPLGLGTCAGLTYYFWRNDPFHDEGGGGGSRPRRPSDPGGVRCDSTFIIRGKPTRVGRRF